MLKKNLVSLSVLKKKKKKSGISVITLLTYFTLLAVTTETNEIQSTIHLVAKVSLFFLAKVIYC